MGKGYVPQRKRESGGVLSEEIYRLEHRFPISIRLAFKKAFGWLFAAIVVLVVTVTIDQELSHLPVQSHIFGISPPIMLGLLCAVGALGKLVYEVLHVYSIRYGLKFGHLDLARGVLLKERGSFPLSRITDIYVDHDLFDLILSLRTVHIATASLESLQFAHIQGLPVRQALGLKSELERLACFYRVAEASGDGPSRSSRYRTREIASVAAQEMLKASPLAPKRKGARARQPLNPVRELGSLGQRQQGF